MYISSLTLRDFRNYARLELDLPPGISLFYGPNAAGKTTLLEALFLLATTRSPRASSDRELLRWEAGGEAGALPFARIASDVHRLSQHLRLEMLIQLRQEEQANDVQLRPQGNVHKLIRINRRPVRAFDLVGQLRVVLFTPADLELVHGAPAQRRRYLDLTLSQLDPHYVRTLAYYNRLLQQRNSLLRAWRERRRPRRAVDDELGYWDAELCKAGGYIIAERIRAVTDLNRILDTLHGDLTGTVEPLTIGYVPRMAYPVELGDLPDAEQLRTALHAALLHCRADELHRGQTLLGPHRDDLTFAVAGVNLGLYGSRGQQRSVALALKLAEARLMTQRSGDAPVLLLDDLLSELDMHRRRHVLHTIQQPQQQTLLTATDLSDFEPEFLHSITRLRVETGQVFAV